MRNLEASLQSTTFDSFARKIMAYLLEQGSTALAKVYENVFQGPLTHESLM